MTVLLQSIFSSVVGWVVATSRLGCMGGAICSSLCQQPLQFTRWYEKNGTFESVRRPCGVADARRKRPAINCARRPAPRAAHAAGAWTRQFRRNLIRRGPCDVKSTPSRSAENERARARGCAIRRAPAARDRRLERRASRRRPVLAAHRRAGVHGRSLCGAVQQLRTAARTAPARPSGGSTRLWLALHSRIVDGAG